MSGDWSRARRDRAERLERARGLADGKWVEAGRVPALLEALLRPGDRVCLEGDNQKQADFLARSLARVDPARVHDLHLVQSVVALPEHLALFEKGIGRRLDFSFSGPQAVRLAQLAGSGRLEIGAIHTYLELYARYFVDLTPRVDVPGGWVDHVVRAPAPSTIEPLFTRDPALIGEVQVLMAMMVIRGIYAEYGVQRLNHGIGFDTAAIELLLPTYAEELGLRGKICRHWALNPHPTLIPAVESGFVESVHSFGSELGMEAYVAARPDVFFTGRDGSLRSHRAFSQLAGHYACDLFIGSTLQMDLEGNSSTATRSRVTGFGGAPNMGCDARGRRHATPAWVRAGREAGGGAMPRGRKLVVQLLETYREHMEPAFVERLDAWDLAEAMRMELPPVMIYGDDVTHVVTEEGIANLLLCRTPEERAEAIRAVAGYTPVGRGRSRAAVEALRGRGAVRRPEDLGIDVRRATRDLLAARSVKDLVRWSGGLYDPPARFRSW